MYNREAYISEYRNLAVVNGEVGVVEKVSPPVVFISGLSSARLFDEVRFESGDLGYVHEINEDYVCVVLLTTDSVNNGTSVVGLNRKLSVNLSKLSQGEVFNPLLSSETVTTRVNKEGILSKLIYQSDIEVFRDTKSIAKRSRINESLETGVTVIDLMIPLGRGQKQLILGDRNTGKSSLAVQMMTSNLNERTIGLYVGVGKKKIAIKKIQRQIAELNLETPPIIISSFSADPRGLIYIAPFIAMTIAEQLCLAGINVVMVIDDMTFHSEVSRELNFALNRLPGRESFPANIFHSHSSIMERAGKFVISEGKEASITCFALAETVSGDMSGYIPTSLMSMTDGHIFFDQELFNKGFRPAIDYFSSVTRVGRQTQTSVRASVNRELSSFFSLYRRTEKFVHFGAEVNEGIKTTLDMGRKLELLFGQSFDTTIPVNLQLVYFALIWASLLSITDSAKFMVFINKYLNEYKKNKELKTFVDSCVNESIEINSLIAKVRAGYKKFFTEI